MQIKDAGAFDNIPKASISHVVTGSVVGGTPATIVLSVPAGEIYDIVGVEVTGTQVTVNGYALVSLTYTTPEAQVRTLEFRPFLRTDEINSVYFRIPNGSALRAGQSTSITLTIAPAGGQTWNNVRSIIEYFSSKLFTYS
jgi:hypothetical protein